MSRLTWNYFHDKCRLRAAGKANADGVKKSRARDRAVRAMPAPEANAELQANLDVCFINYSIKQYYLYKHRFKLTRWIWFSVYSLIKYFICISLFFSCSACLCYLLHICTNIVYNFTA